MTATAAYFSLTDVPVAELTSMELYARKAWAQVYLVHSHEDLTTPGALPESLLLSHTHYLRQLDAAGRLYAHGPVDTRDDDNVRELTIIAASSTDEAEQIAGQDPLHRSGHRINRVQGHMINEGVACYVARAMSLRAIRSVDPFDPDAPITDVSTEVNRNGYPGSRVYLISLSPTDKTVAADPTPDIDDHFVWLRDNEMAARLVSCGPVTPAEPLAPGIWGPGLGVVATSREEAERIARDEPSGRAGFRSVSVRGWTIRCGIAAPIAGALQTLNGLP